jgi:aryl-alcohol dehydrogenase-like predicted oxidoreductase
MMAMASMERRRLGRTGHESTVAILGGAAFARCTPEEAAEGFAWAIEHGVNHLDIAPRYGDAEVLVGPHVPAVRDRLFIGEKTTRRDPDGVRAQLDETLVRLHTDHVDLYQLHGVVDIDELDARGRAAEAIFRAREEGVCDFVGITGHNLTAPATFVEALRRYDLDTVMFPVYPRLWADPEYRDAAEELLSLCTERDVGVMAIKAAARRPWPDGDVADREATSWYEPWLDADGVARGIRFALSTPGVHACCTPGDLAVMRLAVEAAERLSPMSDAERADAVEAVASEAVIFPIPS